MVVHNCVNFCISSYIDKVAKRMLILRPEVPGEANHKEVSEFRISCRLMMSFTQEHNGVVHDTSTCLVVNCA